MADPYRDVAAGDQLAALKALPAPMMNRVLAALMLYRAWPFAVFVPPQTKESIDGAGMRYLGNRVEGVLVPMTSQVWTDREQTTQVSASLRGYWMCTHFESGSCILTWDHVPKTPPNEHLEVYGTEESFTLDYEAHLRAVKRKRDAGEVPIVVPDMRTVVALGHHYYRFVTTSTMAGLILAAPALVLMFAVVMASRWIRGR